MKTVEISKNISDPLRFMKKLQQAGLQVLGVGNPDKAGKTFIQIADSEDANKVKTVASAVQCNKIVLECASPRGVLGCRGVKADGSAKHVIKISLVNDAGQPVPGSDTLAVVPTVLGVPISNSKPTLVNGKAQIEVGPMTVPVMLVVHVADSCCESDKRGMELSFDP